MTPGKPIILMSLFDGLAFEPCPHVLLWECAEVVAVRSKSFPVPFHSFTPLESPHLIFYGEKPMATLRPDRSFMKTPDSIILILNPASKVLSMCLLNGDLPFS